MLIPSSLLTHRVGIITGGLDRGGYAGSTGSIQG
jgi:hypothetical protein